MRTANDGPGPSAALRRPALQPAALAYLGTFGVVATPFFVYVTLETWLPGQDETARAAVAAVCGIVPTCVVLGGLLLAQVSEEQWDQRQVYADFVGAPVDVAHLGAERRALRDRVFQAVVERARGLAATGYRTAYHPQRDWLGLALDPQVTDRALLRAALTLCRLDSVLEAPARRAELRTAHRDVWRKLQTLPS